MLEETSSEIWTKPHPTSPVQRLRSQMSVHVVLSPCPTQAQRAPGPAAPQAGSRRRAQAFTTRRPTLSPLGHRRTIESVHLGYLPALVVASQQGDAVRPLGFQCKKVRECLEAVIASIYKVTLQARETLVTEKQSAGKGKVNPHSAAGTVGTRSLAAHSSAESRSPRSPGGAHTAQGHPGGGQGAAAPLGGQHCTHRTEQCNPTGVTEQPPRPCSRAQRAGQGLNFRHIFKHLLVPPAPHTYHEDVVGVRDLPAGPEQLAQVVELREKQRREAAPAAAHRHRRLSTGRAGGAGRPRRPAAEPPAVTCPWMSPQTVTGVETGWTLDSSSSRSHT